MRESRITDTTLLANLICKRRCRIENSAEQRAELSATDNGVSFERPSVRSFWFSEISFLHTIEFYSLGSSTAVAPEEINMILHKLSTTFGKIVKQKTKRTTRKNISIRETIF